MVSLENPTKRPWMQVSHIVDKQGCTDAAPEAPHPRPTRCDAAMREGRRWPRIGAASGRVCHVVSFFFRRLAPMRLRLGPIRADLRRLGPYRPKSAKWLVQAETADSGRNSNTLSHSVTRLSSLCSLRCACARLPWITLRLSVSALRLGISTATQHKCYFPAWSSRLAWGFSKKKKKTQMLLCWPVSCNINIFDYPKMPFALYSIGPPRCTQSHVAVLVILP